ncbi:hypothetical protein Rsub_03151 [Raphidocelis subcapitata]|uniref:Uncharacterized protein n=1 Tax=Raphidocelis subcapitata TaxID=307507 RepID=A0A2V0NTD8_9CHLO|nr:hypothetical protein Rsub_03151 [Raphidocelis subcapitata]|eukprot:GBF90579.1 hypothetical protein Rsub_03151 [Raphidocelis subcapitata]
MAAAAARQGLRARHQSATPLRVVLVLLAVAAGCRAICIDYTGTNPCGCVLDPTHEECEHKLSCPRMCEPLKAPDGSLSPDDCCLRLSEAPGDKKNATCVQPRSPGAPPVTWYVSPRKCWGRDFVDMHDWKIVLRIKDIKYEVNGTLTDADMANECYCEHDGYIKTRDWDEPGGDLPCEGRPFCRVCGGVAGARAACSPDPRCVGFVAEPKLHGSFAYTRYNCSYLKTAMRPAAERTARAPQGGGAGPRPGWDTFAKDFH